MRFVLGINPVSVSDGTGRSPDTEAVAAEIARLAGASAGSDARTGAVGDVLRVPVPNGEGAEGRSPLVHELWRRLPIVINARFYVKAQARPVPPDSLPPAMHPFADIAILCQGAGACCDPPRLSPTLNSTACACVRRLANVVFVCRLAKPPDRFLTPSCGGGGGRCLLHHAFYAWH